MKKGQRQKALEKQEWSWSNSFWTNFKKTQNVTFENSLMKQNRSFDSFQKTGWQKNYEYRENTNESNSELVDAKTWFQATCIGQRHTKVMKNIYCKPFCKLFKKSVWLKIGQYRPKVHRKNGSLKMFNKTTQKIF